MFVCPLAKALDGVIFLFSNLRVDPEKVRASIQYQKTSVLCPRIALDQSEFRVIDEEQVAKVFGTQTRDLRPRRGRFRGVAYFTVGNDLLVRVVDHLWECKSTRPAFE